MAVEANTRKRKHKNNEENVDDGEVVVPKKQAKKSLTPKKEKKHKKHKESSTNNNENEYEHNAEEHMNETNELNGDIVAPAHEETSHENSEADNVGVADFGCEKDVVDTFSEPNKYNPNDLVEKQMKFTSDFKMLDFRTKLRSSKFITELRHFIYLAEKGSKIAAKYLEKRGKPLELVDAIERIDKSNVLHVSYLCHALQFVIMEVLSNQKQHMESAIQASRYFLKSHGQILDLLLKSPIHKHRRIALKLMTALVCVEPQLGRQLSSFSVLSNVKMINSLLSHSNREIGEEETVRKCFIHFVLAFLVDGNTLLIRNILDRSALLRALIYGLIYDDQVTVCVVLKTLKKHVLECSEISKSKKLQVFNVECIKNLIFLYEWSGPQGFESMVNKTRTKRQDLSKHVDQRELENVVKVAHEFLLILLTSRKHGLAFDAISTYRQKHNALQGKVIPFISMPWKHPLKTELIVKILTACPELARVTVHNYAQRIRPTILHPAQRIQGMDFLRQIIAVLQPSLYQSAIQHMTLTDLTYWIKETCLPMDMLQDLSDVAKQKDFTYRLAAARLILTMFTQYSNFMQAIAKREKNKGDSTLRRLRFDLLSHLMLYFPTIESILLSLRFTISEPNLSIADIHAHLDATFDLFLVISKEHRTFIDRTTTILDFLKLLRPLYTDDGIVRAPGEEHHNIKLEMKAVKTMLLLFPQSLKPSARIFGSVFSSFVKAFVYGEPDVQREAGNLLRNMFKNVGIFEAGELEIDLWLEPLHFYDEKAVDIITKLFIQVLQICKEVEAELPKSEESITNLSNVRSLLSKIESGLSVQAYVENVFLSKFIILIFKGVEIEEPLKSYLEDVCLLIFHYYPSPDYVRKIYEKEFEKFLPYMNSWMPQSTQKCQLLTQQTHLKELLAIQRALVNGERTFEELFAAADDNALQVELNGKTQTFNSSLKNERLIMIYVQNALFVVAQQLQQGRLKQETASNAAIFIGKWLGIVASMEEQQRAAATDSHAADEYNFLNTLLHYIFGIRLNYVQNVEFFDVSNTSHLHYCQFLRMLAENCHGMEHFTQCTENFRIKLVKSVAISMQQAEKTKALTEQLSESLKMLEVFKLSQPNCLELLELLTTNIKYSDYFMTSTDAEQPQRSVYFDVLVCVLQRLTELKQCVECKPAILKLAKFYVQFHKKISADLNLEKLEECLFSFLCMAHQHIPLLGAKFFACFFVERKLTKSAIKLACLMLERDDNLRDVFLEQLQTHWAKKELIYPLLKIAFHKGYTIEQALLQSIYQEYKNGFMKTIEKPQKSGVIYKENVECSIALIEHCMPKSECVDFCNKTFKFDVIEVYQLRIIQAIYQKAFTSLDKDAVKQKSVVFVNYINTLLQMLSVDLKKQFVELEKLEIFGYYLYAWWQQAAVGIENDDEKQLEPDFGKILKGQQWLNLCRTCLKLGMQQNENEADKQQADHLHGLLLKLLAMLCDRMYADYQSEQGMDGIPQEPVQLFEMICTHSKCYDILLSHQQTAVKTEVLHLLYTLAKKSPTALAQEQIPVVLGAYQARLSDADRYALALLQLYEVYDCGLQNYRPFIWGESAISFYALRAADEDRAKLAQQETSIAQVMSLVDKHICEYTLDNFPTWRKLNTAQQMPLVEFVDPKLKALTFGSNSIERRIEWGVTKFSENDLRFCPKRDGLFEQCYDPAFFVPLMNMCFSPEAYAHPARPVQNGLLALTFAALSAHDKDMRLAAASVQLRYRAHFEQNKFFERPLWTQAYDNIQAGLADLRDSWMKHKRNSGTPRVPYIPCLFIAKTFNVTVEPTHLLYKQLMMYLRLKNVFNFETIPEFNLLFFSAEVEHQAFRQFVIELITSGIKTTSDLFLLVSTNTFKVLLSFYGTTMSNLEMNLHILSLMSTCAKIPGSAKIMLEHVGLLSWLTMVISTLEFYQFDVIEGVITILNNFWYSLQATAGQFHNYAHICQQLHLLVLRLLPHMSYRISISCFAKLMNIMNKTAGSQHVSLTALQLDHIINCAGRHFPEQIHTVASIKQFGGAGAITHAAYCQQLYDEKLEANAILALASLRSYTIEWAKCHTGKAVTAVDAQSSSLNESAAVA